MKKLFKHLVLALAIVVAFASQAFAAKPIYGKVVDVNGGAPVNWTLYATDNGNNTYTLVFSGAIKAGYHGYSLTDQFSAPYFEFKGGKKIGGMTEPLKSKMHSHTDEYGDVVKHYKGTMMFVQNIQAAPDTKVTGAIGANICTDATNQCQQCAFDFEITLAPVKEEAAVAPAEEKKEEVKAEVAAPVKEEAEAQGEAQGLRILALGSRALDKRAVTVLSLDALQKMADGQATKIIYPFEVSNLLKQGAKFLGGDEPFEPDIIPDVEL